MELGWQLFSRVCHGPVLLLVVHVNILQRDRIDHPIRDLFNHSIELFVAHILNVQLALLFPSFSPLP